MRILISDRSIQDDAHVERRRAAASGVEIAVERGRAEESAGALARHDPEGLPVRFARLGTTEMVLALTHGEDRPGPVPR